MSEPTVDPGTHLYHRPMLIISFCDVPQVQDAISCLYYIVQQYGRHLAGAAGAPGSLPNGSAEAADDGGAEPAAVLGSLAADAAAAGRSAGAHALVHAAQTLMTALQVGMQGS